jgi:hypothetical protein
MEQIHPMNRGQNSGNLNTPSECADSSLRRFFGDALLCSVNAISSHFLELKGKVGKYLTGQDVKRYRILPNPEFFKPSIDVFTIRDFLISLDRDILQGGRMEPQYSIIPTFHYSNCGAKRS